MSNIENIIISGVAEMIGMFFLILLGNGVVAAVSLNDSLAKTKSKWLIIAFGFATALFIGIVASTGVNQNSQTPGWTSGMLNPKNQMNGTSINLVGLIMGLFKNIEANILIAESFLFLFIAIITQLIGAIIAQVCIFVVYKKQYDNTTDSATILGTHSTGPAVRSYGWNFAAEAIGTFVLFFAIAGVSRFGAGNDYFLLIPVILFGVGLSIGASTGYALNPLRDLGPRIFHQLMPYKNKGTSDWQYSWVPIAGPIVGGMVALLTAPGLFY